MAVSQLFYPVLSKSFTLLFILSVLTSCSTEENSTDSATGDGTGLVQGAAPVPVPPLETAPVVTLSVSSSGINLGQSTTLNWSSSDADSCIASGGWSGARSIAGTVDVRPVATSTYTLTCDGADGSASDSVSDLELDFN